jgi:hypothetical protein
MKVIHPRRYTDGSVIEKDTNAAAVISWLEQGAFKALEEGYLQRVIFNVLGADPADDQVRLAFIVDVCVQFF